MKDRRTMLKVKIKSLAAESAMIRLEERRSKPGSAKQCELHEHRVRDVRREARLSLLAYAFIRGRELSKAEPKSNEPPDWARVGKLIEKFGTCDWSLRKQQESNFAEWKAALVPA